MFLLSSMVFECMLCVIPGRVHVGLRSLIEKKRTHVRPNEHAITIMETKTETSTRYTPDCHMELEIKQKTQIEVILASGTQPPCLVLSKNTGHSHGACNRKLLPCHKTLKSRCDLAFGRTQRMNFSCY